MNNNIRNIVITAIKCHPKNCIFNPNAVDRVMDKWKSDGWEGRHYTDFGALDFLASAIRDEEIYCPHEGIDRRTEYYAEINLAGWSQWASIAHEMV